MDEARVLPRRTDRANNGGRLLLFAGVLLLGGSYLLYSTDVLDSGRFAVRLAAICLLLISIVLCRTSKPMAVSLCMLTVLACCILSIILYESESVNLIVIILIGFCFRRYGIRTLLGVTAAVVSILFAAYFLLLIFGLIEPVVYSVGDRTRNTLGFSNVNQGALFFLGVFVFPLVFYRKTKWCLAAIISGVILFLATDTRSVLLFSVAFVALYFVFGRFSRLHNRRGALFFSEVILFATFLGSLCMGYFDNPILDGLSSGRVSMASDLVNSFTLQDWFFGYGQPVWIDNSYLKILASCGLPGTLCLFVFLAVSMRRISAAGGAEHLAFLCASLVLGVLESVLFRPEIMISILFWGIAFCEPKKLEEFV